MYKNYLQYTVLRREDNRIGRLIFEAKNNQKIFRINSQTVRDRK